MNSRNGATGVKKRKKLPYRAARHRFTTLIVEAVANSLLTRFRSLTLEPQASLTFQPGWRRFRWERRIWKHTVGSIIGRTTDGLSHHCKVSRNSKSEVNLDPKMVAPILGQATEWTHTKKAPFNFGP